MTNKYAAIVPDGRDGPFMKVVQDAELKIEQGFDVYQRFTCAGCGSRQTMPDRNKFYVVGTCEECGCLTNIKARGCGFMAMISNRPDELRDIVDKALNGDDES